MEEQGDALVRVLHLVAKVARVAAGAWAGSEQRDVVNDLVTMSRGWDVASGRVPRLAPWDCEDLILGLDAVIEEASAIISMLERDEPSARGLVRVRVWADGEIVPEVADEVVGAMARRGWRLVERSMPYACRPPKQLEARVYLTLEPPARVRG